MRRPPYCALIILSSAACGPDSDSRPTLDAESTNEAPNDAQVVSAAPDAETTLDAGEPQDSVTQDTGVAQDASAAQDADVQVVRGAAQQRYWDLRVQGAGLTQYEGKRVTVLLGSAEHRDERLARAETAIKEGTFTLDFAQAWEQGLYKSKLAFIDVDQNGRCDANSDAVYCDTRGVMAPVLELGVTAALTQDAFPSSFAPAEHCVALNAAFPAE